MRFTFGLAALAATMVAASPASAQQVTAQARGVVLTSESLVKRSDLNFGTITVGTTGGTVSISAEDAANDDRTTAPGGDVVLLPGGFSAAHFEGLGQEDQVVSVVINGGNPNILLDGPGADIPGVLTTSFVDTVLNSTGQYNVYVGGDFTIGASQAAGVYEADFTVEASYN
jgi:hypothetical protein